MEMGESGMNYDFDAIQGLLAELSEKETSEKKHILVVDDDVRVLKLLKVHLEDYKVAVAVNGRVALKFLENNTTDLILLDYEMPIENGEEIFKKLRSNEKTKNVPVIFLTGMAEREKIQEILMLKPQGYLLKPINKVKLLETIKQYIG